MSKIIACLDIGDVWTGIALADKLCIAAYPHSTILSKDMIFFLKDFLLKHTITHLIVGYPITLSGTQSKQTLKVVQQKENIQRSFPALKVILWDERLSSQRAQVQKRPKNKEEKNKIHARAAAVILESYLLACYEFDRHD